MKSNQRFRARIKPLAAAVLLLSGTYAHAAYEFAATPLYLQNETTETSPGGEKPKIMLLIDDSGSMQWVPGADRVPRSGERSRLTIVKSALSAVLNKYQDGVQWGLQTLNKANNAGSNPDGYTTNYASVVTMINRINANGGTPTTPRYYEVSKIVRDQTKFRCDRNSIVVLSDGDANGSWNATWQTQYTSSGKFVDQYRRRYDIFPQNVTAYFNNNTINDTYFGMRRGGGYQYATMVRLDGSPGVDLWDTIFDRNDGMGWFSKTLSTKDFKTGGNDGYGKSWDGDPRDPRSRTNPSESAYKNQIAETYTVGFGEGLSAAGRAYLEAGASNVDNYVDARNESALVEAFAKIFSKIESNSRPVEVSTVGATAPATSSSGIPDMAAVVQLDTGSWSSRLQFYQVNRDGSINRSVVSYPSFGNRATLINDGTRTHLFDGKLQMTNADFGISDSTDTKAWDALRQWTVREGSDDQALASSKKYRIRATGDSTAEERNLGDILDGSVATIGDKIHNRQEFMVAAANDGMVHMFQSVAGNSPYDLKLSYIPAAMERDTDGGDATTTLGKVLKDLAHEEYGTSSKPHRYMVNGGFVLRRTPQATDKSRQAFMFGAMGQGGRGAYALNLGALKNGNAEEWASTVPLFETAKGEGNKLGYTIGSPQIGRVSVARNEDKTASTEANVRYAGFLGSGYRHKDVAAAGNETALYVYNMLGMEFGTGATNGHAAGSAGELLRKITVPEGVGGLSEPTLVDSDFDGLVDVAYAGDHGGNMYRFDLRGQNPGDWTVSRVYKGVTSQPITAAPAVSRINANHYVVIFGTGQDIYQTDLDNKDQQAVYGIYDHLDKEAADAAAADLQVQTMTVQDGAIYLTDEKVDEDTEKGWMFNLAEGGERVVVKPTMLLRTAVITTRKYNQSSIKVDAAGDKCLPESESKKTESTTSIIGVNSANGGALGIHNARFTGKETLTNINGSSVYANGLVRDGIINFTFMNSSKLNDSPVTADGDSGGSGTDGELTPPGGAPRNTCFTGAGVRTMLLNNLESFTVEGRGCGLRRISWREIFF